MKIEITNPCNLSFEHRSEFERQLDIEIDLNIDGKEYTVVFDIEIYYDSVMWYFDDYGEEYEWRVRSIETYVNEIWTNDDDIDRVEFPSKDEYEIQEYLNQVLLN